MSKVLVGRDAYVYLVQSGGDDLANGSFVFGNQISFYGVWKDIKVTISNDWVDVTPSSGQIKEKRRTTYDWKANLSNVVRTGGSTALALGINDDYIYIQFTEVQGGGTIYLIGGISEASYERNKEAASESLDIENVGPYGGGVFNGDSIVYA